MSAPRIAVHLGYHKTATSWLQREILPRHPRVRSLVTGSPRGAPFVVQVVGRSDRDFDPVAARAALDEQVDALGAGADDVVVVSAERLSGHAASGGDDTFRIARRLHATVPEARVFFAVREQVAMIESEYRQLVHDGSPARLADLLAGRGRWVVPTFDLGHYEYDTLADEYVRRFGADAVRVYAFESIAADQAAFLADLAVFLGLEPWPDLGADVLRGRVNPGSPTALLELRRRLNHFRRSELNPDPVLALGPAWRRPVAALAGRLPPRRRPLLDPATAAALRERFRAPNERLAARHGVALPVAGRDRER
jgi:hypothetical protein